MDFQTQWQQRASLVEEALRTELTREKPHNQTLAQAMAYSLFAGGKRLRPVLLMAAADAVGKNGEDFITCAAALEMIHTYSLIHDDLPAMDNDDLRRGKPTNHKVYGEGMAILAGDALLTYAFEVMLRQKNVSAQAKLAVVQEMSSAAGPLGMVGGQALDLESEGQHLDQKTLYQMHMDKTGALFRAALRSGAILAEADDKALQSLTHYAEAFGLAFQITDDILDATGDIASVGKTVGSDVKNHKATYVTLLSLEKAQVLAASTVQEAEDALQALGTSADFLRQLARFLLTRKA